MSILEHFPAELEPRNIQKEILDDIENKINSGFKKIIISAPTGVGKSAIGVTIGSHFGNSFMITASKNLQDQYIKDHPILHPVKGKSNFPCMQLMEKKKIDDPVLATTMELTCEKGKCEESKSSGAKVCEHKPKIQEFEEDEPPTNMCEYYTQKYIALTSSHSLWNYHSFFQLMLNKKAFAQYIGKSVSVFDEAHKIEDQIIQFIGMRITKKQLDECSIPISRYNLDEIDDIISILEGMRQTYGQMLHDMDDKKIEYDFKKYSRYSDQLAKTARTLENIHKNKENFVINEPQKDIDGDIESVEIKPIDIADFIKSFFDTDYQIFMSATIDKKSFCETMGFSEDDVAFIDTPKSPFPLEHRRVEFLNVKRLNNKSTFEDKLEIVKRIDDLLTTHSEERGLILTSSIYNCTFIKKHLSPKNRNRIRICHSSNPNQKTQDQIIKEHENDSTGVLISSSLWEGVDLKDDLSRFQIIAKIPYPPMTEKRTVVKMNRYPLWYDSQTLMKLLQGFGRSIRSENDWARTYVLDSAVNFLIVKTRNIIPKAYHDILNI